jgi:acetyl esterase/lipase
MRSLLLLILATPVFCAEPITLPLWPEGPPGQMQPPSAATADFIKTRAGKSTVTNISQPTIAIYRPDKPNGACVIVAPGGAYAFLSAIHEGTQVCEWLNTLGVTGVLLNYRTPTRDEAAPFEKPVQDAQRAIGLLRHRASEWAIDPARIGVLGFSAGGNLLAHLACDRGPRSYAIHAEHDVESALPNFAVMIYGGGFMDFKEPTKFQTGFTVPKDAPPMFLACAHDDGTNPIAMTSLYLEYKRLGIPAELHICSKGGHGFGMRKAGNPINDWPARCGEWMQSIGLLDAPK